MERGVCPKSYGMNVAAKAQIPTVVIDAASSKSRQLEWKIVNRTTAFKNILKEGTLQEWREWAQFVAHHAE